MTPASLLVIGEPDDLGNREATFTEAGERVLRDWYRRAFVHDDVEAVDLETLADAFGRDPEGIPQYGPNATWCIDPEVIGKVLRGAGVRFNEHGYALARPRDPLGVHFGKTSHGPRVDIVANLVPRASVCLIAGLSGALKSRFMAEVEAAFTQGRSVLGRFATPDADERAVYVNTDQPTDTLERHLEECGDKGKVGRCNFPSITPAEPAFWAGMKTALGPALVAVDTLGGATPGASERDSGFALPLKLARRYANEMNAAVIFSHCRCALRSAGF